MHGLGLASGPPGRPRSAYRGAHMQRFEWCPSRWVARLSAVAMVAALAAAPAAASAQVAPVLRNGGFESGTLGQWLTSERGEPGDGWSAATGTVSPLSEYTIPAPLRGSWQAVVDQTERGSHVLYRDLDVTGELGLNLTLWYRNRASRFITPQTLGPFVRPNQQLRLDLVRPTAPVRSMADEDILATLFRTRVGAPLRIAPRVLRRDLSRFAGQTVRLRIAEVDNQGFFQAGVDAVRLVDLSAAVDAASP
jgi:hypothetical protein